MAETEKVTKPEVTKETEVQPETKSDEEAPAKSAPKKEITLEMLYELLADQKAIIEELKEQVTSLNLRTPGSKTASSSPMTNFDDGILRIVEDYDKGRVLLHGKKSSMAFKDSVFKPNGFTYAPSTDYGPGWVGQAQKVPELLKLLTKANANRRSKVEVKKVKRADMDKIASKLASIDDEDEEEVDTKPTKSKPASKAKKPASSEDDASSSEEEKVKPKAPAAAKPATRKLASKSPAKGKASKKKEDSDDSDDEPVAKAPPKKTTAKSKASKKKQSDSDVTDSD